MKTIAKELLSSKLGRDRHVKGAAFLQDWFVSCCTNKLRIQDPTNEGPDFLVGYNNILLPVWAPTRLEHKDKKRHPRFGVNTQAFDNYSEGIVLAVWFDASRLDSSDSWIREAWAFLYKQDIRLFQPKSENGRRYLRQPPAKDAEIWATYRCDNPSLLGDKVTALLKQAKVAHRFS